MSLSRPSFAPSFSPAATLVGSNANDKVQSRPNMVLEGNKERIKKIFGKVELSASSYDTAWVAMIPSPSSPQAPLFPQTLNWLLENQHKDGSWGLTHGNELLTKDSLLSTLASVLALKHWNVGELQTNKGLQYIESNIAAALDDRQFSPIGFDIIFSHLIESAQKLDLNLPVGGSHLQSLIRKRELELKRGWESNSEGWQAYLAYISEGLGKSQNWEMAMKFQRKNGSLLNSPATTAAAFTHLNNSQCLDYLLSLFDKYDNTVPTVHPLGVYAQLHLVDCLEKLGIDRYFQEEIQSVLDETYRLWQQDDEDIFLEPTTCAVAFRLLRLHGYDISSDEMNRFSEDKFCNTLQGYLKDAGSILELHKSSQIVLRSNDSVLEEHNLWTRQFLEEYLSSSTENAHKPFNNIDHEVRYAVRFPYQTSLDRILNRTSIENYKVDEKRMSKTSYSLLNLETSKDMLELAVQDFNHGLSMYQKDLQQFSKWFMESGLDKLHFEVSKTKLGYSFMTAAGGLSSPEHSEARLAWAKNGLLVYVVDDLYDVWGSQEEQIHLLSLMEKWDVDVSKESCSETVKILFLALKAAICEIAEQASKVQGRSVLNHLIQLWVDVLRSFMKEAEWSRNKSVPTMEEYEPNSIVSLAMGVIVLPSLYLVGPKLPHDTIQSDEYNQLFEVLSFYGRLLNDVNGYKREREQGKLNSVALQVIHESGVVTEEEIIKKIRVKIDDKRKELMRLVLQKEGSVVPREVKNVFWKMAKLLTLIYKKDDVMHENEMPQEMFNIKDALLGDPILFNN
ncbi:hypothetical protein K1719_012526 [Acacia pycnantha]|nr:hypothetical protein K1719_012526 [Acacia pycnantha]